MPEGKAQSRPLHLQTIDSLFAELICGVSISVGGNESEFKLDNIDGRAILNWYRLNRTKWVGNVMAVDVEALVSAMSSPLPSLAVPDVIFPKADRQLRLVKMVAHRFGGIHSYGTPALPPDDFEFMPREPITLFEGWNGAGKTSILNAIIWCLTGEVLRPQREPEKGQLEFNSQFVRSINGGEETTRHALTPVTPLPDPTRYLPPVDEPVPADTWVELTFADQQGNLLPPVRRTQLRTSAGKISETQSGFESLGVDPIALRIGSIMPALLQFLRVGSASDLGLAAAKLTGLADIASLARHATKARSKLRGELKKDRELEIAEADSRFMEAQSDLGKLIADYLTMAPGEPLPSPSIATDLEEKLDALRQHFDVLKASVLSAAKTILGEAFDPGDKRARDALEACIGPAQGQLKAMAQLPSVRRMRALSELGDQDWQAVDDLIAQIRTEAAALAELAKSPELGRRKQLYARVASWMTEFNVHDRSSCGVCNRSLDGVIDPVTSRAVKDHLAEVSESEQQLLSLTQQRWAVGWVSKLIAECPGSLRSEISADLPSHPRDLIRKALVDDLFETVAFKEALAPLKQGLVPLCDKELAKLPGFAEPGVEPLPAELSAVSAQLLTLLRRLARARSFVLWRSANATDVGVATKTILQGSGDQTDVSESTPIGRKLDALASIVKGVAPINGALELCQRMTAQLKVRRAREKRLELYARAADALGQIIELGSLAEKQVDGLRKRLHARALHWRDRCYHNSFPMAGHALRETAMDVKGVLDIHVGFEKATAPAQHVSNGSALRASLMGFYLAFWEYVLAERGGIVLLVFDDPQELLDQDNKAKLARLLPELATKGAQLIVATYDRKFAQEAVAAGRKHASIEHLSVHPVNPARSRLEISVATEELSRKRSAYEGDKDNATLAQDYADQFRIYLEARLGDVFDDPAYPAYTTTSKKPTLSDFLGRLRALEKTPPNALFANPAVREFCKCKALAEGAECLNVLNTAHHDKASLSAGDVFAVADELDSVRALVDRMHTAFRDWRWREPLQEARTSTNVVPFRPTSVPDFKVLVQPDLAAFTNASATDSTQDEATDLLDGSWFADKTLFLVRGDNFGFSIPRGCIAIAESEPYEGKDQNLVVARQKGHLLARRLLRSPNGTELTLAAGAPDPRDSKPTLAFSLGDVVVHRVVGMLTEQPAPPPGKGEAMEVSSATSLSKITCAYRVSEESGIPLVLPGQVVLGGDAVTKDRLATSEGMLVALVLSNGSSVFKRVGKAVSDTNGKQWQFESVGGLGASLIVSLEDPDDQSDKAATKRDAPTFVSARQIIGVLYTV